MSLSPIILQAGKSNIPLYEFPVEGDTVNYLYNPDGIIVNYGYDFDGRYRVAYGALESESSSSAFAFEGKEYSSGLHSINLSRPLAAGEEIKLVWYDGHQLVIYAENGYLETIPNSNPHSEGLYELNHIEGYFLTDDTTNIDGNYYKKIIDNYVKVDESDLYPESGTAVNPKNLEWYVYKSYYKYDLTEDTEINPNKKYYSYALMTKVKKRSGGSYNEIGKWADETGSSEHTALLFDDDMNTKRFDKIEIENFEEF